jgi:hypothetical protein
MSRAFTKGLVEVGEGPSTCMTLSKILLKLVKSDLGGVTTTAPVCVL